MLNKSLIMVSPFTLMGLFIWYEQQNLVNTIINLKTKKGVYNDRNKP